MNPSLPFSRRLFLGGALAAGASQALAAEAPANTPAAQPKPKEFARKIKLGLIGCGGRGPWLADLFQKHGGYVVHAVDDYFDEKAQLAGEKLGVDKARRFSGLAGYKRLLESGVEAVAVVNVPRFHAEHAHAAVEAGCHVFAAKPVAVDVPRALLVQAAGKLATQKKLCYLVDYQMPTDPVNIEVVKRMHEGGLGRLMHIDSLAISPPWAERPVAGPEDWLRNHAWLTSIALSGDVITENSIHAINAVLWAAGGRPASAIGRSPHRPGEPARRIPRGVHGDLRVCRRPAVDPSLPIAAEPTRMGPGVRRLRHHGHGHGQLPRQVVAPRRAQALRRPQRGEPLRPGGDPQHRRVLRQHRPGPLRQSQRRAGGGRCADGHAGPRGGHPAELRDHGRDHQREQGAAVRLKRLENLKKKKENHETPKDGKPERGSREHRAEQDLFPVFSGFRPFGLS